MVGFLETRERVMGLAEQNARRSKGCPPVSDRFHLPNMRMMRQIEN